MATATEKVNIFIEAKDNASADLKKVKKSTKEVTGETEELDKGLDVSKEKFMAWGAAGAVAAGALVMAVGKMVLDINQDIAKSQNQLQASLGLSEAGAENFGNTTVRIFRDNFGESITDVNDSLITTSKNLQEIDDLDILQSATTSALRLRDVFEVDVNETTSAAGTLMKEFGLQSEEAFDFITTGLQKGLNKNGDFLDSIGEYSNQFADGNSSAEEFFSVMETGLGGSILGTDKVADAFKELGIGLEKDIEILRPSLEALGIDADDISERFIKGEVSITDAFDEIIAGVNDVDEVTGAMAANEIFRTQGEDLQEIIKQVDASKTSLDDMAGSTEELDVKYQDLGTTIEGWKRNALLNINDVFTLLTTGDFEGGMFGGAFNEDSPFILGLIDIRNKVMDIADEIGAWWEENGEDVIATIIFIKDVIVEWIAIAKPLIDGFFEGIKLGWEIVFGVIKTVIDIFQGDWAGAWENIKGVFFAVVNTFTLPFKTFFNFVTTIIDRIAQRFGSSWDGIRMKADEIWESIKTKISSIIDQIVELFRGLPGRVKGAVGNLADSIPGLGTLMGASGKVFNTVTNKASGGPVQAGRSYKVGEFGAETFTPSVSGTITPHNETNMGGVTINVSGAGDPQTVAERVARILDRQTQLSLQGL